MQRNWTSDIKSQPPSRNSASATPSTRAELTLDLVDDKFPKLHGANLLALLQLLSFEHQIESTAHVLVSTREQVLLAAAALNCFDELELAPLGLMQALICQLD